MNNTKTLNDSEWEKIFDKYDILKQIEKNGQFIISSTQIKDFREPRLMVKFDHSINLPKLFSDNKLSILPISRSHFIISHFDAYHKFEKECSDITHVSLPPHIQSIDIDNISSETIAINCAFASGIIADFLEDDDLFATVSGRMSSGTFNFEITNSQSKTPCNIAVQNSQIEIDAAYEGIQNLALFEAKRELSDDFLIRQLYYPYRVWKNQINKNVRTIFLVYSNGIYHLYEYMFQTTDFYNSLTLVKQKKYSVEDTEITIADIQNVLAAVHPVIEPQIAFPQADKFERIINLCELLNEQELSSTDITEQYAFDIRQANYYADAARYLGLVEKRENSSIYSLSDTGKKVLEAKFKLRQLMYCRLILSHKVFSETLKKYFVSGNMPSVDSIIKIMKKSKLYNIESEKTFERRAATVRGWLNWMIGLITA